MELYLEHHKSKDSNCYADVMKEWADRHKLSKLDRFRLAYFFAITYCNVSAIALFLSEREIASGPERWAKYHKDKLMFVSDRKYVAWGERFEKSLRFYVDNLRNGHPILQAPCIDFNQYEKEVEKWYYFGRFSAFLFLESYGILTNTPYRGGAIPWRHGDTATSGILNLFGYDQEAAEFDHSGRLMVPIDSMDRMLEEVTNEVMNAGGDGDVSKIETTLCSFRKFFKGSRYEGYYTDRDLEELNWFTAHRPDLKSLTDELFQIRADILPHEYLGELNGWTGIRTELKRQTREYYEAI